MDDWMDGLDFDTGDSFDTDWYADSGFEVDDIDMGDYETGYDWDIDSGDSGTNWWASMNGNNGQSTNWMNLLMAGTSSYLGNRENEQAAGRSREHDIALAILRDQLANKEYDRRQTQLSDAYKAYEDKPAPSENPMSLLSTYKPRSTAPGSGYYGY
jgi:hypothetical protein